MTTSLHESVQDYLLVQGLNLPLRSVEEIASVLETVYQVSDFKLPEDRPWQTALKKTDNKTLADYISSSPERHRVLSKMYALCDTVFSQFSSYQMVLFVKLSNELNQDFLCPIISLGQEEIEVYPIEDATVPQHLALRSAQSAWLHHASDPKLWIDWGDLIGERHQNLIEEWAFPITLSNGELRGILYGEQMDDILSEDAQIWWVALAIVLSRIWPKLTLPTKDENENN